MAKKSHISVIFPWHKKSRYVYEALKTIENSINVEIQLLMVDDRKEPEDDDLGRKSIAQTLGVGYSLAVNEASKRIEGEFVALMNSDDLIHPERFARQISCLKQNQAKINVSKLTKISSNGKRHLSQSENFSLDEFCGESLLVSSHIANATWLAESKYWQENISFIANGNGSDWLTATLIVNDFQSWSFLDERLYFYRQHRKQTTNKRHTLSQQICSGWEKINELYEMPSLSGMMGARLVFLRASKISKEEFRDSFNSLMFWRNSLVERVPTLQCIVDRRIAIVLAKHQQFGAMKHLARARSNRSISWRQP